MTKWLSRGWLSLVLGAAILAGTAQLLAQAPPDPPAGDPPAHHVRDEANEDNYIRVLRSRFETMKADQLQAARVIRGLTEQNAALLAENVNLKKQIEKLTKAKGK